MAGPAFTLPGLTRWGTLSASVLLEANAGLQYVFGDVSGALRTRLAYTQRQLDTLGTAKDCGTALVDVLAGFMFDAYGAPATLVFIASLNALGFLAVLAVYTGLAPPSFGAMVVYTAVGFGGNGAMLLPGLVTSLGNFPEVRGMVTGLLKSVFFLCASLYTELDVAVHQNTAVFLLLLALLPACAALACIPLLRPLPVRRSSNAAAAAATGMATRRVFFVASAWTLGLAVFMAVIVLLQTEHPLTFTPLVPVAFSLMLGLLACYMLFPTLYGALSRSGGGGGEDPLTGALLPGGRLSGGSNTAYGAAGDGAGGAAAVEAAPEGIEGSGSAVGVGDGEAHYVGDAANITLGQCLARPDYWCIYTMYVINLATGLTLSNNLEGIATAKGATQVAGYVALASVATCVGTLFGAHISEALLDGHVALQRPWCVAPAFGLQVLGALGVAALGPGGLYASVFILMMGYGANLSILPAVLHERFGQKHFGSIWAFSQTAMVVASLAFATGLAASVYEAHASLSPVTGLQTCTGNACFRTTFLVLGALALVGAAIGGLLATLLTDFYAALVAARTKAEPGGYFAALTGRRGQHGGRMCDDL